MRKKLSFFVVVSILAIALCFTASARYNTISMLRVNCEDSGSSADCWVTFELTDTYKYRVQLWLQRSNDGGMTYKDHVRILDTTQTDGGVIEHSAKRTGLDSSYDYACKAKVIVYDSNGTVLDNATAYSY